LNFNKTKLAKFCQEKKAAPECFLFRCKDHPHNRKDKSELQNAFGIMRRKEKVKHKLSTIFLLQQIV
jgi:hypothetical protein